MCRNYVWNKELTLFIIQVMSSRVLNISPSLLACDFSSARDALKEISDSGCDYAHFDVMDGHFVPDITFGAKFIKDLKKTSDLIFDTHLMVEKPENFIPRFVDAGCDIITIHKEATCHLERCISMIKSSGISAGVAINPGTSVSEIEAVLDEVDYVLVMTVNPGWGGQKFIPSTIKKVRELELRRKDEGYSYNIEVDGGVGKSNIKALYDEGVTLAVMGTQFFNAPDKLSLINEIYEILDDSGNSDC